MRRKTVKMSQDPAEQKDGLAAHQDMITASQIELTELGSVKKKVINDTVSALDEKKQVLIDTEKAQNEKIKVLAEHEKAREDFRNFVSDLDDKKEKLLAEFKILSKSVSEKKSEETKIQEAIVILKKEFSTFELHLVNGNKKIDDIKESIDILNKEYSKTKSYIATINESKKHETAHFNKIKQDVANFLSENNLADLEFKRSEMLDIVKRINELNIELNNARSELTSTREEIKLEVKKLSDAKDELAEKMRLLTLAENRLELKKDFVGQVIEKSNIDGLLKKKLT